MRQEKSSLLRNKGFQSLLASLLCIVLGLLIGYIVLLIINPAGAGEAIRTIVENFLYYPSAAARLRYLGNTLVKTAPLLMCSLWASGCPGTCACWRLLLPVRCWAPSPGS